MIKFGTGNCIACVLVLGGMLLPSLLTGSAATAAAISVEADVAQPFPAKWLGESSVLDEPPNTWSFKPLPPAGPVGRSDHAIAYDPMQGAFVLFGGLIGATPNGETWVHDGATSTWGRRAPTLSPSPRYNHAMAFDNSRGKVVLFGGCVAVSPCSLDAQTWLYDPGANAWTNAAPPGVPSARSDHAMAYDPVNGLVVLFGGDTTGSGSSNGETWVYDTAANRWTQRSPASPPSARYVHAMTYDPDRRRVLMVGGFDGGFDDETWAYDVVADAWTNLAPSGGLPGRHSHAIAYDESASRLVLFGGCYAGQCPNAQTWTLEPLGNRWTQTAPFAAPSSRDRYAMGYDERIGRVVLFGGNPAGGSAETWNYETGLETWSRTGPAVAPSPRNRFGYAYDSGTDRIVLFGGGGGGLNGETWVYDVRTSSWGQRTPSGPPSSRFIHAMAYDSANNKIVMFGGSTGSYNPETWTYDTAKNVWTNKGPSGPPSARAGHVMAYDQRSGRVVLFGGEDAAGMDGETWTYDLGRNSWANVTPVSGTTGPSPRSQTAMAYDEVTGLVVLFGGCASPCPIGDTWVFDGATKVWTKRYPSVTPPARRLHAITHDSANGRTVMFAGSGPASTDVWVFDAVGNNWTQKTPSASPSWRTGYGLAYASSLNRAVLFGGSTTGPDSDETWHYFLDDGINRDVAVRVLSPDGGEDLRIGDIHRLSWSVAVTGNATSLAEDPIELYYSTDGGRRWTAISKGEPNTGSFSWKVPGVETERAVVRVVARVSDGGRGEDVSDAVFRISRYGPLPAVSVRLVSPNGGEDWIYGRTYPITWSCSGTFNSTPVQLHWSGNSGNSWSAITFATENDGVFNWTVVNYDTPNAMIRVRCADIAAQVASDTSDSSFAIDPPPEVAVQFSSPPAGVVWGAGAHTVTWDPSYLVGAIDLDFTRDAGATWEPVARDASNSGAFPWDVPAVNSRSVQVRISGRDLDGSPVSSTSGYFVIDSSKPLISDMSVEIDQDGGAKVSALITDNFELAEVTLVLVAPDGTEAARMRMERLGERHTVFVGTAQAGSRYWIEASDGANLVTTEMATLATPTSESMPIGAAAILAVVALIGGLGAGLVSKNLGIATASNRVEKAAKKHHRIERRG